MASSTSRFFGKCALNVSRRRFSAGPVPKMRKSAKERARSIGCAATAGLVAWSYVRYFDLDVVYASKSKKKEEKEEPKEKPVKLTSRERRFLKFASVQYDGQTYMTPEDFLESIIHQTPEPPRERRTLATKELEQILATTPKLSAGSSKMFRKMKTNGIISYTEYLFLLSILTKPLSGFRIAFNMFDTDGNERIDKTEFLVLLRIFSTNYIHGDENNDDDLSMEKIFSHAWKDKRGMDDGSDMLTVAGSADIDYVDDDQGLQRQHNVDTTLTIHFFGDKGNNELHYEGFRKFMADLQTEILEQEFNEFSKGQNTITEVDFAKILLRYTHLDADAHEQYLERLVGRLTSKPGITFDQFKVFCQFLNNLEDFSIAMRMYTLADQPISQEEFQRAVFICTETSLSKHLVHTVFAIFDEDGDGQLSYREFIAIMKDRLQRGFKMAAKLEGWDAFKACVKQEIKTPS